MVLAEPPIDFIKGLEVQDAGRGCVLLSTRPESQLTLGALAASAIKRILSSARLIQPRPGSLPSLNNFGVHDAAWVAASDAYEQLIAADIGKATHVVCLDLWAVFVLANAAVPPTIERVLISDRAFYEFDGTTGYWPGYDEWLASASFQRIIQARALLPLTERGFWKAGAGEEAAGFKVSGQVVVVEEAEDAPPAFGVLEGVVDQSSGHVVFISPHLPEYQRARPDLLKRCAAACRTQELAVCVYMALLRRADRYVGPSLRPFGDVPLEHLRKDAVVELWNSTDPSGREPSAAPNELAIRSQPGRQPQHPGRASNWWSRLGMPGRLENPAKPDISILTCCYKYLQRLRIFLASIAQQTLPPGRLEVCIAIPGNPDGVLEYLGMFRSAQPGICVKVAQVSGRDKANRGKMLNAAFDLSSAPAIMVADCDLVLPPDFLETVLSRLDGHSVLGCWRTALSADIAAQIVTGNLDPKPHFSVLKDQWDEHQKIDVRQGVLGYCQVLFRAAFDKVRYPEEFNCINQSDIVFIERLQSQLGVQPRFLDDLCVLHLAHPRNWSGTEVFL